MNEEDRAGMNLDGYELRVEGDDIESLAALIAERLSEAQGACGLTPSEQQAVKDLIRTKRNAVRTFLWVMGALFLWILKDIYVYVISHLSFR